VFKEPQEEEEEEKKTILKLQVKRI